MRGAPVLCIVHPQVHPSRPLGRRRVEPRWFPRRGNTKLCAEERRREAKTDGERERKTEKEIEYRVFAFVTVRYRWR